MPWPAMMAAAAGARVSTSAQPTSPSSVATRTSSCQSPLSVASSPAGGRAIGLIAAQQDRFDFRDPHD